MKNQLLKNVCLGAISMLVCMSSHAQNRIHNVNDLQRVLRLKEYVETHPVQEGQTNSAIQQLNLYEHELSKFSRSNENLPTGESSSDARLLLVPVNDNCSGATLLTENSTCTTTSGDLTAATQQFAPDSCNFDISPNAFDVWYKFVAVTTNPYIKVVGSVSFDAIVILFDSCGGSILGCSDATFSGGTEIITSSGLTIGHTYVIRVFDYGTAVPATPTFDICVYGAPPAPANDGCANAVLLSENASCIPVQGNSLGATQSFPADSCNLDISPNAFDVWYKFVAVSGSPHIQVVGSFSFDAIVFLFDSCGGSILGCADATFDGGTETIIASGLTPGHTYLVRVYCYGNSVPATTTFDICVFGTSPPPANDNMCSAASLALNGSAGTGNTSFASPTEYPADSIVAAKGFLCSVPNNTVWYSYTAATTDSFYVVFTSSGGFKTWLGIFKSNNSVTPCLGTLVYDSCAAGPYSAGAPATEVIGIAVPVAGTTFLFMIDGVTGSVGAYSIQLISSNPLGVSEAAGKPGSVSIYPNPTSGILTVDFGMTSKKSSVRVYDVLGNLLKEVPNQNSTKVVLDVLHLSDGIYFVQVENENGVITQKIILNR